MIKKSVRLLVYMYMSDWENPALCLLFYGRHDITFIKRSVKTSWPVLFLLNFSFPFKAYFSTWCNCLDIGHQCALSAKLIPPQVEWPALYNQQPPSGWWLDQFHCIWFYKSSWLVNNLTFNPQVTDRIMLDVIFLSNPLYPYCFSPGYFQAHPVSKHVKLSLRFVSQWSWNR